MPEADRELITEHATVQQIRELKRAEKEAECAGREERQRSLPLIKAASPAAGESAPESGEASLPEPLDLFNDVMSAFWEENRELFAKAAAGLLTPAIAAEEICPSGSRTYRKGPNIMFFYDIDKGIKLRGLEKGKPVIKQHTYKELLDRAAGMEAGTLPEGEENVPEKSDAMPQYAPLEDGGMESRASGGAADNEEAAIDGEYREIGSGREGCADEGADGSSFTDLEIECAIGYFETEYKRMTDLVPERALAKARNYRIALECIRRYKPLNQGRRQA